MNEKEFAEIESSQKQHDQFLLHNEQICNEAERHVYSLFNTLAATLQKDGNKWCVLYGEDLQVGIAGFGDNPHEAILNWGKEMKK